MRHPMGARYPNGPSASERPAVCRDAFPNMRPRSTRSQLGGFSLVETLVVVTMLGILMLMVIPRVERSLARVNIVAARVGFSSFFLRARNSAIQSRKPVVVSFASGTAVAGTSGVMFGQSSMVLNFQGLYGVSASASGSLTIQPTGIVSNGTPFVLQLTKGSVVDTVQVTGFGRVE